MLSLVALLPMLPTLRAAFLYDDTTIIRDNATLRGWSALARAWSAPYWPTQGADASGLYRPVHVALLAAVWNAGRGAPLLFHMYALALYAVVVLLVWRLLRSGVGPVASTVATLWFATQPLHVETVASVANSSELLVVGWTIALVMVIGRARSDDATIARGWTSALLVAALSAAAVLSKESGLLALPLAALTAWGWRSRRKRPDGWEFLRARGRLFAAGGAAIVVAVLARAVVLGAPVARVSIAAPGLDALAPLDRVVTMLSLWPRIARMLLWPGALSPYYGPTILPPSRAALALLSVLAAVALGAYTVARARRGETRPLVALAWVVLTYLPAANLLTATGQIIADRTLFGATVGVALAVGIFLERAPRYARRAALAVCTVALLRDAVASARYAEAWSSHRTLWTRLVETSPSEYRGYQLLGIDARERGDSTRALALLARAYAMEPRDRRVRFEYGEALYTTGRYAPAAEVLSPLLRDGDVRSEAGFVAMYLDAVGRSRGAAGVVAAGTPLLRGEAAIVAALNVGAAYEQLGRPSAADSAYASGLRASPTDSTLLARRASVRSRLAPR
ncbi:MAG: Tetratricopeptide 2 repeat protein [Gemmatimonadetes bacterium]|nr:Tetratricopeptide 2 repeat protein [Gemmatimonadota bacterium]